jgi:hypothetical protein
MPDENSLDARAPRVAESPPPFCVKTIAKVIASNAIALPNLMIERRLYGNESRESLRADEEARGTCM